MKWFYIAASIAGVGWMVVLLVAQMSAPMNNSQLKSTTSELRSYAVEGQLLAEQAAQSRAPSIYRHVYAAKLADLVNQSQQSLNDASCIRPEVRRSAQTIARLSEQVHSQIDHLAVADLRPSEAAKLAAQLAVSARELDAGAQP